MHAIFTDGNRTVWKFSSKSDHLGGSANMEKTRDEIWLTRGTYVDVQIYLDSPRGLKHSWRSRVYMVEGERDVIF